MSPAARRHPVLAGVFLAAIAVCVAQSVGELRVRRAVTRLARSVAIPSGAAGDLPEAEDSLSADVVASAAVASSRPEIRAAAHTLMLSAAAANPGWPYHRYLVARTDPRPGGARMRTTLQLAAAGAPGTDAIWSALARTELESWSELSASERADAPRVFRRALQDADFARGQVVAVTGVLGSGRAMELLPDDPAVLTAGTAALAEQGDVPGAGSLLARANGAERRKREGDLADLDRLARRGDADALDKACRRWFDAHPYRDFDDREGRRQAARLLALWPDDRPGSWERDRRAGLIRYFLDGRLDDVAPDALLRAADSLNGVPASVRARVHLLAGNERAAVEIEKQVGGLDTPEWDAYYLLLSRRALARGELSLVPGLLAKLSTPSREGCEGILAVRALAIAEGDAAAAAAAEEHLRIAAGGTDWSQERTLSVCVDPAGGRRDIPFTVGAGAPALIAYGWDGARSGIAAVGENETHLSLPLTGLQGKRTAWVSFLFGGADRMVYTGLRAPS